MERIDSHQHFWKFDPVRDQWISDEMSIIRKDFLPENLMPSLIKNGFVGSVIVQSSQSEEENRFQLRNAENFDFIKGVVGWVDLEAENVEERLQHFSQFKKLKGFRHILETEPERNRMLRPGFMRGIGLLNKYNFTYDILILKDQLKYVGKFVSAFPDQPFVIDHIAKPDIRGGRIEEWKKEIKAAAKFENVFCKISGMVTEADWKNWRAKDFIPYLDVIVESFGTGRIMFGSDWPVCLVVASYEDVVNVVEDYFSAFSIQEQNQFFGLNANRFYKL